MSRVAISCGKADAGEPEDYKIVYWGYTGESADTTHRQAIKEIPACFPREEWDNAKRNMLVMDPRLAAGQYPCVESFATGRPSRL